MARGLATLAQLDAALDRLARRGRSGITTMRELIAEAHDAGAPAGSNLELVTQDILETAGFGQIERQVPIYDAEGFIARVDFGDRRRRIAVEVDSDRFHGGLVDRSSMRRRPLGSSGPAGSSSASPSATSGGTAPRSSLDSAGCSDPPRPPPPPPPPSAIAA